LLVSPTLKGIMKLFGASFFVLALTLGAALPAAAVVKDDLPSSPPITFSDGAVASTLDHCGTSDVCARIKYKDGTLLTMVSEGAAFCQPYIVHFVRSTGETTNYEFSRTLNHDEVAHAFGSKCGNNVATQLTMDHGLIHLTIDEYTDGTLRFLFTTAGNESARKQAE